MCKEEEHQALCALQQVPCLNAAYGCPFTMARFKVARHLQACPASIVSCSMEWNRWPTVDLENILHKNLMKEEASEECLDMALALRDQKALFRVLKMADLFPECKEKCVVEEKASQNADSLQQAAGPYSEASDTHEAQVSPQEGDNFANDNQEVDLVGYQTWESMFSKELKACKVTGLLADGGAKTSGGPSLKAGKPSRGSPPREAMEEASHGGANEEERQCSYEVNLAMEKTGLAPWQDGVLERLKKEVPVGDYNMYLVHHGRMLIHFGQLAACTPKEKDFVYGNLEAQEVKTVTSFRLPVSYYGKRARLGDPMAHKKPSKSVSMDTSELGISLEDLPKSDAIKATLLCALEKELKGHEISETKSTDALFVDFGTQTYSFAAEPFSSTTVLADVLDAKEPPSLCLQLHSESVTQRHNKSSSAFTFSCNQFFRRDEFGSHFKNVHADIQSGLDGWFQQRCPLAYLGCTFVQHPWRPAGPGSTVIYSPHQKAFAVKPDVEPALLATPKYNLLSARRGRHRDALSSLPSEILKYIAGFLDSFTLSQLAQVSVLMRDICATLLQDKGMVFLQWEKKQYSHGGTSWRVRRKASVCRQHLRGKPRLVCPKVTFLTKYILFLFMSGPMVGRDRTGSSVTFTTILPNSAWNGEERRFGGVENPQSNEKAY